MDEQYIRRVIEGDTNAFRFIISKYKDMSFSIAISIVKSDLTAEEAVQDAFVKAFQNLRKFKFKSKFSTWLYKIVVNEAYDEGDSLKGLNEFEQREIINSTLKQMPSSESLVLRLFYLEEYSIAEVKEVTGLNNSNVKVILHRARKRFYSVLEKSLKHELRTIL